MTRPWSGVKQQYADLEFVKKRAKNIKYKTIENLDRYLVEFETNFTVAGGSSGPMMTREALQEILKIVKAKKAKTAVKAKSMATEDPPQRIPGRTWCAQCRDRPGEFIQQLDGEPLSSSSGHAQEQGRRS